METPCSHRHHAPLMLHIHCCRRQVVLRRMFANVGRAWKAQTGRIAAELFRDELGLGGVSSGHLAWPVPGAVYM